MKPGAATIGKTALLVGGILLLIWANQPSKPIIEPDPWVVVPAGSQLPAEAQAQCRQLLDTAAAEGLIRAQPTGNRINVDERLWTEISADSKRGVLQAVSCLTYNRVTPRDLEYVVAYGHRSGKRLAMLTSAGAAFE